MFSFKARTIYIVNHYVRKKVLHSLISNKRTTGAES